MAFERYAKKFNEAGFAVLTYDYRHFGTSGGMPRQMFSMDKQLDDCRGAIEYARNRKEIDADKIIIWGTSGGGGYGVIIAASDKRIACVSCQCPVLVQICEKDNLANPQGGLNTAEILGDLAEVRKYPIGHFDIYFGEHFRMSIDHQIQFYKKHVGPV